MTLLGQKVDSLGITILNKKLKAVISLDFPSTLR